MPPAVASLFSLLLVVTGAAKLRRPEETARAIRKVRIPFGRPLTLLLGGSEVVIGAIVLFTGLPIALSIQAGMYALFLIWIGLALRLNVPLTSCGCLGRADTPPYWGHIVINIFGIAASLTAATVATSTPAVEGVALFANLSVAVVGAGLAWAILDQGSRAHAVVNR